MGCDELRGTELEWVESLDEELSERERLLVAGDPLRVLSQVGDIVTRVGRGCVFKSRIQEGPCIESPKSVANQSRAVGPGCTARGVSLEFCEVHRLTWSSILYRHRRQDGRLVGWFRTKAEREE